MVVGDNDKKNLNLDNKESIDCMEGNEFCANDSNNGIDNDDYAINFANHKVLPNQ